MLRRDQRRWRQLPPAGYDYRQSTVTSVGGLQALVRADAQRVAVYFFSNANDNAVWVGIDPQTSSTNGIPLRAFTALVFSSPADFTLPAAAWFLLAMNPGQLVTILEVVSTGESAYALVRRQTQGIAGLPADLLESRRGRSYAVV